MENMFYHDPRQLQAGRRSPPGKRDDSMNIYIGNLSLETTEEELREAFTRFGQVLSITLMNDKYIGSGQPRGYGYIQMGSKESATNAIANLSGKTFRDHVVSVTQALPLTKHGTRDTDVSGKMRSLKKRERTD